MNNTTRTPVVFIHGLWLHASSWESWVELFRERGYAPVAPGWPGIPDTVEAARANPDAFADHGIEDITDRYRKLIDGLPARPIVIGHSFGGMIAEKLLGEDYAAAAIGIDAAQIKGVLPLPLSSLRVDPAGVQEPGQPAPGGGADRRGVPLRLRQRGRPRPSPTSSTQRWAIPSPAKPLFEAAAANFSLHSPDKVNTENQGRGPLLLIMSGQDHTVPEAITKSHPEAVPALQRDHRAGGVPRPRPLADHRLRLARGRRRLPGLAREARTVI